ncbi:MAG TPA: universal stress protein [Thermoleophilaceae bacterium]|nr:universal stress protein [Thermoleophilaceae bacterium]
MLLCYDGSRESANAITRAGELFGGGDATVVCVWSGLSSLMLHAPLAGPPTGPLAEGSDMLDEPEHERAGRRAGEGAALARAAGFKARPLALKEERNVWHTLRDHATDEAVTAMVVGARGLSRVSSVMLGSVSTGLVHHAPVPLLVVPPTADVRAPGPVVFCDDGSEGARRAITTGRRLLRGPGLVLSVWRPWVVRAPYTAVGAGTAMGMAEELDDTAGEHAATVADRGAEIARRAGGECATEAVRHDGPTWRGLIEVASDHRASAIVVGSRGLTGIASTLGSVSTAVAHHSPRPVMVVPPGAGSGAHHDGGDDQVDGDRQ